MLRMRFLVCGVATAFCFASWTAASARAAEADLRLVNAAATQDAAEVRALLEEGLDVDAARPDGATALLWAAHWDGLEMVDLLLGAGADVNQGLRVAA